MTAARRTLLVVGGLIGAPLLFLAFYLTNWKVGLGLSALLVYEAAVLVNRERADTISEAVWVLARRPLVPFLAGLAAGWAITAERLQEPWLIFAAGFLGAHFFFQAQEVYERYRG